MRTSTREQDAFLLDYVVGYDLETLQPPAEDGGEAQNGFMKWPHHRPLVASFVTAAAKGGGEWEFNLESVLFEEGREAEAYARIEDILPEHGTIVGHNSRGFDAPVLSLTSQAARCFFPKLSRLVRDPRFGGRYHADTAELFSNRRAAQTPSLAELCRSLGIPCKLDVNGGDVQSLYDQGRIPDVVRYCEQDAAACLLLLWSWAAARHCDEAQLVEPLAAFVAWVQAEPNLAHLRPFATCPMAAWASGRGLVHQLNRAAEAAETRLKRASLNKELSAVINF